MNQTIVLSQVNRSDQQRYVSESIWLNFEFYIDFFFIRRMKIIESIFKKVKFICFSHSHKLVEEVDVASQSVRYEVNQLDAVYG